MEARQHGDVASLAHQLGYDYIEKIPDGISDDILARIPPEYAVRSQVMPIGLTEEGRLRVAVANPLEVHLRDELSMVTGQKVELVVCETRMLSRAIEERMVSRMLQGVSEQEMEVINQEDEDFGDPHRLASEALTIRLVNLIFRQAVTERASDIHIEPFERELKLRYRIDGVLVEMPSPPRRLQAAIASRIKILASLNIAERRLPQDGRIKLRMLGKELDVRVSTVPTLYGESIVMRLLDKTSILLDLPQLGFPRDITARYESIISKPHGILLVTGPTGSGKTTTLYSTLNRIYSVEKKIITIEDPVEYQLPGVNQIAVKPKIDLTFANGLRAILRQDPDIIMVGEIRDRETAEIAVHASLTGHFVLSTLHTNDAAGAITRLLDMGIDPYLVASSVIGILAQRLVRIVCPTCKEKVPIEGEAKREMQAYGLVGTMTYVGTGCPECRGKGYLGRQGIFELLIVDDEVRDLTLERASAGLIRQSAVKKGMRLLREDGWRSVLEGVTTPEEVYRVTQGEIQGEGGDALA